MEIKIGEYVRTKRGIIDKVIIDYYGICNSPNCNCKHISCQYDYYDEEDIVKHSKNIIDLVEVGDYVNGKLIHGICGNPKNGKLMVIYGNGKHFNNEHIKSIVTKEQIASIEYKI